MKVFPSGRQAGLSLIELMIALLIGSLLVLGVVQVFAASRAAYMLSEGMARAQENSRFAMDFLQRDIRMAGHFGCVNDVARGTNLITTFGASPGTGLNFPASIQGYEANGTAPGGSLTVANPIAKGGSAYSPALPSDLSGATPNRVNGSDIIVLRFLAGEGVPVTGVDVTGVPTLTIAPGSWDTLRSGVDDPGLFGVSHCGSATLFQASATNPGAGTVAAAGTAPLNAGGAPVLGGYYDATKAERTSTLHRIESVAYYVGVNAAGNPGLYRARFNAVPNGSLTVDRQELVEGIENLQLIYGQIDPAFSTAYVNMQRVANGVDGSAEGWAGVGSVQVAMVAVSPGPAVSAQATEAGGLLVPAGVNYTPPGDARYRAVYQTTVALRNRLFGDTL